MRLAVKMLSLFIYKNLNSKSKRKKPRLIFTFTHTCFIFPGLPARSHKNIGLDIGLAQRKYRADRGQIQSTTTKYRVSGLALAWFLSVVVHYNSLYSVEWVYE